MPLRDKYIKRVEAAKILEVSISQFLDLEKNRKIPQGIHFGMGQRWSKLELQEFKKNMESNLR